MYAPRGQSDVALPVVVFFYGGAWSDGARRHYGFAARALAALGHVVVVPDYRLVPEVEYPDFLKDCAQAVDWVSHNIAGHGGDWTRLVLAGHSAGAYNAAALAVDGRWLSPAVRQTIVGVIGLSGPYDFYPFDGPISRRVFGAAADPKGTQPINHVSADAPPMLLVSGGKDELVLPRNSVRLGAALEAVGVKADVQVYPRLGHPHTLFALSLPLRWLAPVRSECRDFLADVTGQAAEREHRA
ncbi:alpha/beta hydrolase [Devosia sp. CAU 1758]